MAERHPARDPSRVDARVSSFYLASTPYHLLLALADAEHSGDPARLFFFGAFPSAALYLDALQSAPALLPGLRVDGLTGGEKGSALRRAARGAVRKCLRDAQASRMVVFNDRHDLSQLALALAARRRDVRRVCLEDGSSFYTQWLAPAAGGLARMRKRCFTAPGWTPIRVLGTHPLVQEVRVLRPDAVRPELRERALGLDLDLLGSPVLRRFGERLVKTLRDSNQLGDLPSCPEVLLAPPLEHALAWAERARPLAAGLANAAVKHHPRQPEADPGNLLALGAEISRHLPLELLFLHWGRTPALLIGDGHSTALLSARMFDARARVIGLCVRGRPEHAPAYERLGIELMYASDSLERADAQ